LRCYKPSHASYKNYGGRDIKMCPRWYGSFEAFLEDVGERPGDNYEIDRIDGNGDYEPDNCRWVTCQINQRNRRDNVVLTYRGKTQTLAEWSEELGMRYGTLAQRLYDGWDPERVLSTPIHDS